MIILELLEANILKNNTEAEAERARIIKAVITKALAGGARAVRAEAEAKRAGTALPTIMEMDTSSSIAGSFKRQVVSY